VQFGGDFRDREIVGTGVLHPDAFRAAPEPVLLTPAAEDEAVRAWNAVTAPTPDALQAFLAESRPALPLLGRALRALVHHYPDRETGISAWDRVLLQQVPEVGPRAVRVIGHTMAEDLPFPEWASDPYLFWRLRRLGDPALARPLVTLAGTVDDMRQTEMSLTADGEAVLAGRGHFVEWNGIDDHVAGVHVRSATGDLWYRDGERLVRAEPDG
jgi:hypothetical protein